MEKETTAEKAPNILEMRPVHAVEWRKTEKGRIELLRPRFTHRWLVKYVLPRMKNPNVRIKLDDLGSWVWQQIDGKKTVYQIGLELQKAFGSEADPVYDRLGLFMNLLARRKFILLLEGPLQDID